MRLEILVSGTGEDKLQPCSVFGNEKGKTGLAGRKLLQANGAWS